MNYIEFINITEEIYVSAEGFYSSNHNSVKDHLSICSRWTLSVGENENHKAEVRAPPIHTRDQSHVQIDTLMLNCQFGESDCISMQLLPLLTASTAFMP